MRENHEERPSGDAIVDAGILDGPLARLLERNRTGAAALSVGGAIVWERGWRGSTTASRFDTQSVGKAFTAAAVGLLEADGALALDDRACRFLPEWAHDGRRDVTVRHLLTMTSGLAPAPDDFAALRDPTALVLAWPLAHAPGAVWRYDDAAAHALVPIITRASGRQPIELLADRVLGPIDAGDVGWMRAETGDCLGGGSVLASARELCRFGELLRTGGRHDGRALLPERFVAAMRRPDPLAAQARAEPARDDARRRGYGLFTYVNAGGLWPGVDRGAFALLGAFGNVCLVDPARALVFVRLVTPEGCPTVRGDPDPRLFGNALDVTDLGTARLFRMVLRAFERGPARRIAWARDDAIGAAKASARRRGVWC